MRRECVIIACDDGLAEVEGYTLRGAPGLAVTAATSRLPGSGPAVIATGAAPLYRADGWKVTHMESGLAVPMWFAQRVDAAYFALLLAKGCFWGSANPRIRDTRVVFDRAVRVMLVRVPQVFDGHASGRDWDKIGEFNPTRWITV